MCYKRGSQTQTQTQSETIAKTRTEIRTELRENEIEIENEKLTLNICCSQSGGIMKVRKFGISLGFQIEERIQVE